MACCSTFTANGGTESRRSGVASKGGVVPESIEVMGKQETEGVDPRVPAYAKRLVLMGSDLTHLAEECGVGRTWLSQVWNGHKALSIKVAHKIEAALDRMEAENGRDPSAPTEDETLDRGEDPISFTVERSGGYKVTVSGIYRDRDDLEERAARFLHRFSEIDNSQD